MDQKICYHCGNTTAETEIIFDEKSFCCKGCQTVYEIFSLNDMSSYYDFQSSPGAIPQDIQGKFDFLDNEKIVDKLLDFKEEGVEIVTLYVPHIHCSSCIWILENLNKLKPDIRSSQVNFPEKTVRITYNSETMTLKELVILMSSIGYEPYISLDNYESGTKNVDRSLLYKLGVAFFSFGNVMLLSFPEYFEVEEFWLDQYKGFFRWLIFALSLPSLLYAASGYFISAYKSIRFRQFNIDIPIALGLLVMFLRSTIDIINNWGQGYFDSLTGLVFFMLLGKYFQQRTYSFLSFERDYKSYFPIAITRISAQGNEESVQVYDVVAGDRLLIRNQELIPVDGILIKGDAQIDYSFVTGESVPVEKKSGDTIFAGGKQISGVIEMEVLHSVSQSYLTQLWSNAVFQKKTEEHYKTITDTISHYFTPALLALAFLALLYWLFIDVDKAFQVFTAILIVACPCALALTAPFTLGNVLRILGNQKMYLKSATVIEQMAKVDTLVFDKTGTLTTNKKSNIQYEGVALSAEEQAILKNALRGSNHPLSRMLYDFLPMKTTYASSEFDEIIGKGIIARINGHTIKIGSAVFVGGIASKKENQTEVHININNDYKGYYLFKNQYRAGLVPLFKKLHKNYLLVVLSGDNEGEREALETLLPENTQLIFNQKPDEKLLFIEKLQQEGKTVMMVGDGLNDAGALAQSNVGVALSENVNVFSPACDAILDASVFEKLQDYLSLTQKAIRVIKMSFGISLAYNAVGLSFAITGHLSPLVAAIIMPLSSISVVSFVTLMSNFYARKLNKK
ncbi:heavy metal translocating P-type ATPase metal-binding domain-containing protein [Flavobacterium sp. '19STA2R22 D10 B1']|uniref:heavy metal translocating P-type ATPase metal-binding domain-containing protein n=1 Tax=Flavobacterium aerium TaxID=3037261 RepID=UPI00278C2C2E|nr:heavy metal translocating P-type ATPase metal-binding domain-containing protein [Flavobacterium sp. '19STA2R22 D10 B1']